MEAISPARPAKFAAGFIGAAIGLATGLCLHAAGALTTLNGALATLALSAFVVLLVPTTSSGPASGVEEPAAEPHDSSATELDRWLASRAAMGRSIHPTNDLAAEAGRCLGKPIHRERLVAAWERHEARRVMSVAGGAA